MYSVIASDGKSYGPVDMQTLRTWCLEGRVTPDTSLIDAVSGRMLFARDLQDLYDIFPKGPPPPSAFSSGYGSVQPPPGSYAGGGYAPPQTPPCNGGTPFGAPTGASQAPYYHPPTYSAPATAQRSRAVALILAIFLGGLGIHRFYMGYTAIGVAMLVMSLLGCILLFIPLIVVSIWVIVDIVMIAMGTLKDAQGYDLV